MGGIELSHSFYVEVVAPLLGDLRHAATLLGDGSEVLGFDDDISTDHGFGPRLQVFVHRAELVGLARDRIAAGLPDRFAGLPVAFTVPGMFGGRPHHQVVVTTTSAFFVDLLHVDPAAGMQLRDWLLTPTQRLATLTAGAVFHDPDGEVAGRRAALAWYPDDVWRYVLAAQWLRVSQEHAFVGRSGARGDELGSRVVAGRLVRDLMRLAFLVERRWAPYSKWFGRAFADLAVAPSLAPHLHEALAASSWRAREAALVEAAGVLGAATNRLGSADPVDPGPRAFHDRDISVVDAEGYAAALCAAIQDAEVVALLRRLGRRHDAPVGRLPGAIDQALDSTDVLTHPGRCRAAAEVLGLSG